MTTYKRGCGLRKSYSAEVLSTVSLSGTPPVRYGNPMPTQRRIGFNPNITQTEFGLTQSKMGLWLGYPNVSPLDFGFGEKKGFFAAIGVVRVRWFDDQFGSSCARSGADHLLQRGGSFRDAS